MSLFINHKISLINEYTVTHFAIHCCVTVLCNALQGLTHDHLLSVCCATRLENTPLSRFNSVVKFSPTKLNQTEFLTNKGISSYLFTEGALDFSPTKKNLLLANS